MTKYLCDLPHYTVEYYKILERIAQAQSEEDIDICEGLIERFYQKFGTKVLGFWWFTWTTENKPVHSAYESLKKQLEFRRDHVYRMAMFENISEE